MRSSLVTNLVAATTVLFSSFQPAHSRCIKMVRQEQGAACNGPDSTTIWFKNSCQMAASAEICIRKSDRIWDCGSPIVVVAGGGTISRFVCHAAPSSSTEPNYRINEQAGGGWHT